MSKVVVSIENTAEFGAKDLVMREIDGLLATVQVLETLIAIAEGVPEFVMQVVEWEIVQASLWDLVHSVKDEDDPAWDTDAINARISVIAARLTGQPAEEIARLYEEAQANA